MRIQILGSAAGGGFPQWNCHCRNCDGLRGGSIRATQRTQSSIALSDNGQRWILCNASPDIRAQLAAFPVLTQAGKLRGSRIAAVILLDAQIDHCTGLLSLREGCPLPVCCTAPVHQDLSSGFPLFPMLKPWNGGLQHCPIELEQPFQIAACADLRFTAIALASNAPPYSPRRDHPLPGDNIGLWVEDIPSGKCLFYAPGLGQIDQSVFNWMQKADCLLVDGTFWRDDEMQIQGLSPASGRQMGHLPQSGEGGMLDWLEWVDGRKVLIHINNTNPILHEDSVEHFELKERGVEVAYDGMSIEL
ncbi:pyrroloquinoline quinone biosynthesis protein B [Ventosimonas gracilis]|uniref:Coenzyme PQQ synthesis protein B n=1 Tax=Ventosimonas gracilis TaxID=1680762 RepID=A0A139SRS9_9GAMM|nr:pyrroloquinoline quinone biosynthesis protein PqqB [Ventosimonas gracilis]KXU37214.1 pyrroloquinoline quinone biosynthesis protein B [Ventosimonas gracilis]